ncbi:MAG: 50S ribosomal protein L15 [Planctomycetaceae bacterium]|jgi:large subunit ribosomal protein L15|nr:50S ribosomal protein L15 [Planctomycetaceae bacterium]
MNICEINSQAIAHKESRRVGRGIGSGRGKTSQRGHKGQGSRSGSSMNPVFEGGQMPLVRRIPKRGFNNKEFADVVAVVNLRDIDAFFGSNETVTPEILKAKGLIKGAYDKVKVLSLGGIEKPVNVSAHVFSAEAKRKIEAAGGKADLLPGRKPVVKNKMGSRKKAVLANIKPKAQPAAKAKDAGKKQGKGKG